MRTSINWLRELAPGIEGTPEEVADRLSMTAVAVDDIECVGGDIGSVVVARVEETVPHPNADRLGLATISTGEQERIGVVVGAPVQAGSLYPWAPPGTTLPGGLEIGSRKIRGEESRGMLCSERELGLGHDHAGILQLPADLQVGDLLAPRLGYPDYVLELDLTPNRADMAGHLGVARELAPDGEAGLVLPSFGAAVDAWRPVWQDGTAEAEAAGVRVLIEDPERCSRFLGIIIRGVKIGPSPSWLAARLWAIGGRPINNVVDATNYVMHEVNHPLHAYDLRTLAGPEVRVRAARTGERLFTLDGVERELSDASSVITDRDRVIGLAGVMGGADTEVGPDTTDVFLECAIFDPLHTRRTARQAGLATDASYRFERGVDHTDVEAAIARCARLIVALAGGEAAERAIRAGRLPGERPVLRLRPGRVEQVLGRRFEVEELAAILEPIGFARAGEVSDVLPVVVPGWRGDVTREIDLVEEIARRYGYNRFTGEPRALRPSAVPDDPAWERADSVRRLFVARGYLEARSASFVSHKRVGTSAVELRNPMSAEENLLRTDLISTLLDRVETNLARGRRGARLFEIGSVFEVPDKTHSPALPKEELRAAFVLTGRRRPAHWSGDPDDADVWDLKGLAEEIAECLLGASVDPVDGGLDRGVAPGRGDETRPRLANATRWLADEVFTFRHGKQIVGVAGRIAEGSVDAPRWLAPIWAGEFRLDAVRVDREPAYVPLSPYPAVQRDLALVVSRDRTAEELEGVIREAAPPFLQSLRLFDVYEGDEISGGARSLAWRFLFRASDRTLTDDEVETAMKAITSSLEETAHVRIRQS